MESLHVGSDGEHRASQTSASNIRASSNKFFENFWRDMCVQQISINPRFVGFVECPANSGPRPRAFALFWA